MEDAGWQPIGETQILVRDLVGLINSPLYDDARARIALLLYCHITEANFLYHCIYNLLLSAEGQPPKVFNFLDKYKNGVPPSVATKLVEINAKADQLNFSGIKSIFNELVRVEIRNAFFHSDYIIVNDELRLKHRGSQYAIIPLKDVFALLEKTMDFFNSFMGALMKARRSFPPGYIITGRTSSAGTPLCSVEVLMDEQEVVCGFQSSDPLPIW